MLARWPPPGECRLLLRQSFAFLSHNAHHGFDQLGQPMPWAEVVRHIVKHLSQGHRRPPCAIGGNALQCQGARLQGRLQPRAKLPEVVLGGMMVQYVRKKALVMALLDRGEETERAFVECIDCHRAGEVLQGPGEKV